MLPLFLLFSICTPNFPRLISVSIPCSVSSLGLYVCWFLFLDCSTCLLSAWQTNKLWVTCCCSAWKHEQGKEVVARSQPCQISRLLCIKVINMSAGSCPAFWCTQTQWVYDNWWVCAKPSSRYGLGTHAVPLSSVWVFLTYVVIRNVPFVLDNMYFRDEVQW